jgi:hypothetical protein
LVRCLHRSVPGEHWWYCGKCESAAGRSNRKAHNVKVTEDYLQHLYSADPDKLMSLSIMKCPVRMLQRASGFVHMEACTKVNCLVGPLIKMDSTNKLGAIGQDLNIVLRHNLQHNPLLQKFITVCESTDASSTGVPVVSSEVIQDIIAKNRSKDPRPVLDDAMPDATNTKGVDDDAHYNEGLCDPLHGNDGTEGIPTLQDVVANLVDSDSEVEDIPVVVDYMLDMGQDSGSEVECDDLDDNAIDWFGESSESESECSAHNNVPAHGTTVRHDLRAELLNDSDSDKNDFNASLNTDKFCTVMDPFPEAYANEFVVDNRYHAGNVKLRDSRVSVRDKEVECGVDGICHTDGLSIETGLFPMLFPNGKGSCTGHIKGFSMAEYLNMRVFQLFSSFTLINAYMLVMFQLFQTCKLCAKVNEVMLEKSLHKYMKANPDREMEDAIRNVVKKVVPSAIVGSSGYHRKALQDLLAIRAKYGMPSFFLTLTSDELSDLRWEEIGTLDEFMSRFGKGDKTWKDAPVECARLFHDRVSGFMKEYILPGGAHQLLGRVTHHVTRYECQFRGSLHAHILLWVDEADVESVSQEIMASLPYRYSQHPLSPDMLRKHEPAEGSTEWDLLRLVLRKQLHKCRIGAYSCKVRANASCKMCFPYAINKQGTVFDDESGRYLYFRFSDDDQFVVPYHPLILLLWRAHMNIQRITDTQWSYYVLKYASKIEPIAEMCFDQKVAESFGLYGLSDTELQVVTAALLTKPVSPAEATCIMSNIPIIHSDVSVTYVDIRPLTEKEVRVTQGTNFIHTFITPPLMLYINRHKSLYDRGFEAYFTHFEVRKRSEPPCARGTFLHNDQLGNKVYQLHQERVVRFTEFCPQYVANEFFFKHMIMYEPFHTEQYMLSKDGNYYNECIRRGILNSTRDLEKVLEAYCQYHMSEDSQFDILCRGLTNRLGLEHLQMDIALACTCSPDHRSSCICQEAVFPLPLADAKTGMDSLQNGSALASDLIPDEDEDIHNVVDNVEAPDASMLTADQKEVFDCIVSKAKELKASACTVDDLEAPVIITVSGGPGTGKTTTSDKVIQQLIFEGFMVLVTATTAAAALRYNVTSNLGGAQTVHRAAQLPIAGQPLLPMHSSLAAQDRDKLGTAKGAMEVADVMFCDEMSMLTITLLYVLLARLRHSTKKGTSKKILVLVGDHAQLPPVCHHKLPEGDILCHLCHIMYSTLWQNAVKFNLTKVFRQAADVEFMEFLNIIRMRKPTQSEIDHYIGMCFWHPESDDEKMEALTPDTTILCTHRKQVAKWNALFLSWMNEEHPDVVPNVYEVHLVHNVPEECKEAKRWVRNEKHHPLQNVGVGARMMVTENIDVPKGIANSAQCTCTNVVVDSKGVVQWIEADFTKPKPKKYMFSRSVVKRKYMGKNRFLKKSFPLALAYALTAHKCQGATITGPGIIDVLEAFAAGQLYVMLSRFQTRSQMKIIGRLTPDHFVPVPLEP